MKNFLCIVISFALLLSLCGCKNTTNEEGSSAVEVIYEEIIYQDDTQNNVDENTVQENDVALNSSEQITSSEQSVSSDASQSEDAQENILSFNDEQVLKNVKLNGRCDKTLDGISLNHAASAIEFNTNSSSVLLKVDASAGVYYTIVVDGVITKQHQAIESSGTNYVVVTRGLSEGEHNIKFIRDSESRSNVMFTVVNAQLDDGCNLLAKDSDKNIVEFLGDSLTSGFGNFVEGSVDNAGDLKYLSATKAYPYLVASELGLDYRIVSMSGIALGKREGYPSFPEFYGLESYHLDKSKKYASSNAADVDIVVVNLGTNDVGAKLYDSTSSESIDIYKQRFTDLITKTGYSKDAKIVFITGIWHKEPITAINEAVTELKAQGFDSVYTLELKEYKSGGGSHPSGKEHREIADAVSKFLKDNGIV